MKLLFLGPPGAGKGTQAQNAAAALGVIHISTGDMFRRHMADGTPLGEMVRRIIDRGGLVPDSLTAEMLFARLSDPDAAAGYILDGFPRTLPQARALDEKIGSDALDAAVVLEASEQVLAARMRGRGRADDTEAAVRNRLAVYRRDTAPLIDFYQARGIAVRVSGEGDIAAITERILAAL